MVQGVDLGRPIPRTFLARLGASSASTPLEIFIQGFNYWTGARRLPALHRSWRPARGRLGRVLGASCLGERASSQASRAPSWHRPRRHVAPGRREIGEMAVIVGEKVSASSASSMVSTVFAGPYVFCSLRTERRLLHMNPAEAVTFVVARRPDPHAPFRWPRTAPMTT
ncbi:MAG: hypothetical protein U0793_30650 [Gemmataceae bacterium]